MSGARAFVEDALAALSRAVDGRGELRNAQLATLAADGRPGLRTLVLRRFEPGPAPVIEAHSDSRAAKVAEIERAPAIALLCWSPEEQLQLRFNGAAQLHRDDALTRQRWEALSDGARQPYGLSLDPGQPAESPNDGSHLADARAFFTVIRMRLDDVDVLRLGQGGRQTRAQGRFTPDGLRATWVGA